MADLLTAGQLCEALISGRCLSHIGFARRDDVDAARSIAIAEGLFRRLASSGSALRDHLLPGLDAGGRGQYRLHLAVGALVAFGAELPERHDETLANGLVLTTATDAIAALLQPLAPARRRAIEAAVESKRV